MDIFESGATIRRSETKPFCNSEEHKTIGLGQQCKKPVCNTEIHKEIGLGEPCIEPICNSEDHKEAGLEKECTYYCNSEEYKNSEEYRKVGDRAECILDSDTLVPGRALNNAWMYDGDFWNDVQPMSIPRDRAACTLVQASDGVSF